MDLFEFTKFVINRNCYIVRVENSFLNESNGWFIFLFGSLDHQRILKLSGSE